MNDGLYLALDQGGHASRAILYDARGQELTQAFAPIDTRHTDDGYIEHDPEEIVESLQSVTADIVRRTGDKATVLAAGLATQRSSIVCWNRKTGAALSPVISWQDRRNAVFVDGLRSQAAKIHALTGLVLSPHYGASKLRWCLQHLSPVKRAAQAGELAMGPLSSFLLFRLLAEQPFAVDPANASRTQLWNPATGKWAPELLDWFGVPVGYLPQPVASRYSFGTLQGTAIPLSVCTGDQSAVPLAFGPVRTGTAYVNLGTGAFILRQLERALVAPPLLSSILWSDARQIVYALEGTVNGAGSALEWLAGREGVEAGRMLTSLGEQLPPGLKPPLFLNGISGLGSPFWIPDFDSRFEGRGTTMEKFIAVLESILFLIRLNLEEIRRHAHVDEIVATGGLAASDLLCGSLADLTNLPVIRHGVREATARGLAFLTAGRPADWKPSQDGQVFQPKLNTGLRERFFAWLKAMKQAIDKP